MRSSRNARGRAPLPLSLFLLVSLVLWGHGHALAQSFPQGAVIIEQRSLPSVANRALVLWMMNPQRGDPIPNDMPYTCSDQTRGDVYSGPTRVSLVNPQEGRIINTIEIHDPQSPDKDSFDLPYAIRPNFYYRVDAKDGTTAGKPTILNYRDLTGEGSATQFVLYDEPFCMGLQTALVGYSQRQDRVIQYTVEVDFRSPQKSWHLESLWIDYAFSEEPAGPGHFQFQADYRARGGALEKFDIAYDRASERFRGTCTVSK